MSTRKYRKTRRAEQESQTRDRIVEALVTLHQEVGPASTTVKAVAEKAGVQRLTVYRYFPDETAMLDACSSHWWNLNPPPDPSSWTDIGKPDERCLTAIAAFFHYYRRTEQMWTKLYRDMDDVKALKDIMKQFEGLLDNMRDELVAAWKVKGKRKQQLSATIRHCLTFSTWQSLSNQNLSDKQMLDLVAGWLQ